MGSAVYQSEDIHPSHRGNPFIEALRPSLPDHKVARLLARRPAIKIKDELSLAPHIRVHSVAAITDMYVPDSKTLDLYSLVDVEMKRSLRRHRPFSAETQIWLDSVQAKIQETYSADQKRIESALTEKTDPMAAIAARLPDIRSILVVGPSGKGKSSAIGRVLALNEQVIEHTSYMGKPFRQKQLVWLSVFAPINASISGLCNSIFKAVDEALGLPMDAGYAAQYDKKHRSNDTMIGRLAQVLATHYLGILHIDDVQRIAEGSGANKASLISFIMQLSDVVGIPMILSGTGKLLSMLSGSVEVARRTCSAGTVEFELAPEYSDDSSFATLMKGLFKFALVPIEKSSVADLQRYIFDRSQDVTAVAVNLFVQAQILGLRAGEDVLSKQTIDRAYARIKPLHPALDALRKRDMNALQKFEDIASLDQILKNSLANLRP